MKDHPGLPVPARRKHPSALHQAVKEAQPDLSESQVNDLLHRSAEQERELILHGLSPEKAKELAREDLFPSTLDPWAGDEKYGPSR